MKSDVDYFLSLSNPLIPSAVDESLKGAFHNFQDNK